VRAGGSQSTLCGYLAWMVAPVRHGTPRVVGGRYEVESSLGSGGMAEVVLARDRALGRQVAVKLLAPHLTRDPVFVERFRREATAIASLNHPNVVVVHDHGVTDGQPFIAMEHVAGQTLKQRIAVGAPFSPETAIGYARQILAGLEAAHAVGIVHRDVKPQNLLVRDDGTLKVADFGVARSTEQTMLTEHGFVIGTADYISPEQARGEPAHAASDLYSVGVVLFEMLTGALPFAGESPVAVANQHASSPAPLVRDVNPEIPQALASAVDRALAKDPARRYPSAAAMSAALAAAAATPDPAATLVAPADPAATLIAPPEPAATLIAPTSATLPRTPRAARGRAWTRRRVFPALLVLVVLLGSVFVLASRRGDGEPPVRLPALQGTKVATASASLRQLGFAVTLAPAQHAPQPPGTVARVLPTGATAARGSALTIVPSAGPAPITVPRVAGLTTQAAVGALEQRGFAVRTQLAYGSAPAGTALATTPSQGAAVPPGSPVLLAVSAGPAPAPAAQAPTPGDGKGHGHDKPKGPKHGKRPKGDGRD
jgi:eukaryotic-like serine/threonine-protein kinase